jgi:hypothetical protein
MNTLPIDWQRLCLNLRKHQPLSQFAKIIDCDEQTLTRLARGDISEPRFSTGLVLLDLYADLCGDTHTLWKN